MLIATSTRLPLDAPKPAARDTAPRTRVPPREFGRDGGARPMVPWHSRPFRPGPGRVPPQQNGQRPGIFLGFQDPRAGNSRRPRQARPLRHPRGEARWAHQETSATDVPGRARANRTRLRGSHPRAAQGKNREFAQPDGLGPRTHRALLRIHDPAASRARVRARPTRSRRPRALRLVPGRARRQVETERGCRERPHARRDSSIHRRRHRPIG